jgi:hypothetical protein
VSRVWTHAGCSTACSTKYRDDAPLIDSPADSELEPELVRAGSAPRQQPLVPGGHERSRPANPESQVIRHPPLRPRKAKQRGAGSNPTSPAAAHQLRDTTTDQPRGPMSSKHPPSSAWFEHAACWGTTMPVTRDSPSILGDVPGPDPARAPPNKAIARAGSLSGVAGGGLLASQGPRRGAPLPPRASVPVHVWSTCHRNRAVPSGLQWSPAVHRSPRSQAPILGKRARGLNPDKWLMAGGHP